MNFQAPSETDWLGLAGLAVVSREDGATGVTIHVRETLAASGCLRKCEGLRDNRTAIHKYGTDEQRFRDTTLGGKPVTLVIERQRYRCMYCKKTFCQPIASLDGNRHMTIRMVEYIARKCLRNTNMNVADELGVDEGTVRGVFRDWYKLQKEHVKFETPEILGIDEICLTQRMPRCVLVNVAKRRLFDILPNRKKDDLRPYFTDLPDKGNVRALVADMWRPYHDIAKEFFPERPVVVDKFHVVRMANNGLDIIRKRVGRSRTKEERIELKDVRLLLGKRSGDLSADETDRVNAWLSRFRDLRRAYRIKELFSSSYDAANKREAAEAFDRCIQHIPPELASAFNELTTAYNNWKPQILNYFDYRITNGYTECANGLIRLLQRNGRGYSFEVMRARMLYDKEARSRRTSIKRHERFDPNVAHFLTALPDDACDRAPNGLEYGPSIEALVEIFEREERDAALKDR